MAPGARNKFGAPMFEPKVSRKQIYCIEESTCDIVGNFRSPGHCAPLPPSLHLCLDEAAVVISEFNKVGGPLRGQGKSRGANVNVYPAW